MPKIRVLVAEDSLTVRKRLCEVLSADPEIDLVGDVNDGKQAIELCRALRPDVITMDMMMPVMSGLAATEYIMAHCPTPIVIVSASVNRGELFKTYEALAAGAVDVFDKPSGEETDSDWERRFVSTVKLVSRIRVITHPRARLSGYSGNRPSEPAPSSSRSSSAIQLVALGASTGGPSAIVEILRGLPTPFPVPILFVLHINEPFGKAFAEWLDGQTGHSVGYAVAGQALRDLRGRVVMAPPDLHLLVQGGRLSLSSGPERNFCRPSVDVLFESIARECGAVTAGCLLTGMGRDGASGLLEIRRAGGFTISQDEASSVVYGMPREAARIGAARSIIPLERIPAALVDLVEGRTALSP
ncbi:MAG TPA: chemotaxis-specific protein-glutamate methyltransferase CheB [Polyangiaceae bacterium]